MNCPSCDTKMIVETLPSADEHPIHEHAVCPEDDKHPYHCKTQGIWIGLRHKAK